MKFRPLIAECTAYDFKVMLEEKKHMSWLKSVSASANGLVGSLFFGMDNDGRWYLNASQSSQSVNSSTTKDYYSNVSLY